jgi:hypothetical protein
MTQSIDDAARSVCKLAAQAVVRYATISGMIPNKDMPEAFLSAFIFDKLGGRYSMTLETRLRKLWDFERETRQPTLLRMAWRQELRKIIAIVRNPGVDLVLYQGDPAQPESNKMLALIELKKWWISTPDRLRLLRVLEHVRSCPHGAICSVMEGSPQDLAQAKKEAIAAGDRWFSCEVPHPLPHRIAGRFTACIRYFDRRDAAPISPLGLGL